MILPTPGTEPDKKRQPVAAWVKPWVKRVIKLRWVRITAGAGAVVCLSLLALYVYYARVIDQRLRGGPFADSVNVYAAPLSLSVGDEASAADLGAELRMAGYRDSETGADLSIIPADGRGAQIRVRFANGRIIRIEKSGKDVREIDVAAPLITTLSRKKEERLLVRFDAIPQVLVHAILSAEDKHFFHHDGVDLPRIAKAAFVDMKDGRKEQGASTLTMQLVRGLWLDRDKEWKRKVAEVMMTIHLEREWSKEKIFETYANQVYLGR